MRLRKRNGEWAALDSNQRLPPCEAPQKPDAKHSQVSACCCFTANLSLLQVAQSSPYFASNAAYFPCTLNFSLAASDADGFPLFARRHVEARLPAKIHVAIAESSLLTAASIDLAALDGRGEAARQTGASEKPFKFGKGKSNRSTEKPLPFW